ncbi:RidA family protein [Microbacterium sp. RD1]|uniref:RidA family protein n=1 Tax=Microbacterium sp. RD1 TaxID=3457313 RepID=UPI003FA56C65
MRGEPLVRVPGQSPLLPGAVRAGGLVYTSGLVSPSAFDRFGSEATTTPIPFDVQAREALDVLLDVLEQSGASPATVIRLECFLSDARHFTAWNAAFQRIWPEPGPARTTLIVGFATDAIDIEVQAIAVV